MIPSYIVFNSHEVRFIEQEHAACNHGHCFDLMLRAGQGVFRHLIRKCSNPAMVWIFAGKGNNGGDGYVVANCLMGAGIPHRIFAAGEPKEGTEAYKACRFYLSMGGVVETELPREFAGHNSPALVVDALLGTGISEAPHGRIQEWIRFINRLNVFTIAIDVPSGVDADTGCVAGDCVQANLTVCTLAVKPGVFTSAAVDYAGEIVLEDLGVDLQSFAGRMQDRVEGAQDMPVYVYNFDGVREDLPIRLTSANKGDSGKVLIIGGAKGFGGAAILAAMGAVRAGAGLVKAAVAPENISALNSAIPEAMSVDFSDAEALEKALSWADVIAVGPGLGTSEHARDIVRLLSKPDGDIEVPLIFDADALNILATEGGVLENRILTPHPGEAARLLSTTISEVNHNRLKACTELQARYGGVVLLKGPGSIVCDGLSLGIIQEGSPAMATGGMGDVLTGITAALVAQKLPPSSAMITAACLHGRAGKLAAQEGVIGTMVSDLLPFIRRLVNGKSAPMQV